MTTTSPAVSLARTLIGFDTRNPGGDESACIEYLGQHLSAAGFTVKTSAFAESRPSLVARRGPGDRPALCFAGHVDTVPLGNAPWRNDPFGGEIVGDRLYGRGACDMKGGIAALVTAACQIAPRLAAGDDLILAIVAGEETGCLGSRHLAEHRNLLGHAGAVVVGEPTGNYPLVGHKGALWLSARFHGRTAHGAMPEKGDNAVYKAAVAVGRLQHFDFGIPPHSHLGGPSLNVGTFHGGLNINSVPDVAEIGIDIRTMPGLDHGDLTRMIQDCLGSEAEVSRLIDVNALWTPPEQPWVQTVFRIAAPFVGEAPTPRTVAFFTDGAPLQAAYGGAPTLILGPGASTMAHRTDEFCPVSEIEAAATIYQRIAEQWYNLPPAD